MEEYIADTYKEKNYTEYFIRANGLAGTEAGLRIHKMLSTEQYADNFALQHFLSVVELAKQQHLL